MVWTCSDWNVSEGRFTSEQVLNKLNWLNVLMTSFLSRWTNFYRSQNCRGWKHKVSFSFDGITFSWTLGECVFLCRQKKMAEYLFIYLYSNIWWRAGRILFYVSWHPAVRPQHHHTYIYIYTHMSSSSVWMWQLRSHNFTWTLRRRQSRGSDSICIRGITLCPEWTGGRLQSQRALWMYTHTHTHTHRHVSDTHTHTHTHTHSTRAANLYLNDSS